MNNYNKQNPIPIAITTGDPDGIGMEVTSKALDRLGPQKGVQFYLFRSKDFERQKQDLNRIDKRFKRIPYDFFKSNFSENCSQTQKRKKISKRISKKPLTHPYTSSSDKDIFDIPSSLPAPVWVHEALKASLSGKFQALVTGPLSKKSFLQAGYNVLGHTEAFKKWTGIKRLFMAFIGKKCSLLLATGHIPLSKVKSTFTKTCLKEALLASLQLRGILPISKNRQNQPIGVIGLNPHAGENGLIGKEEKFFYKQSFRNIEKHLKLKKVFFGPLVPDVAFLPHNLNQYSVLISPYHDQGLIGFKTIHKHQAGVHVTMGLPFIRTSVSHGTACDIAGKNKAKEDSMREAILTAIRLSKCTRIKT